MNQQDRNNVSIPAMGTDKPETAAPIIDQGTIAGFGSWMLDEDGLLVIDGKGKMPDWAYNSETGRTTIPWAMYRSFIKKIRIVKGVTCIGDFAFVGCRSLTDVAIPDSVWSIGLGAFKGCTRLISVPIPSRVVCIEGSAFQGCESLTNIAIPNSMIEIGWCAFEGCKSLTSVTIPDGVIEMGSGVFNECESLTSITLPNSVTSLESYAFARCKHLTSVTIPNSVTSIGGYAFEGCKSLTNITIPDSVTSIRVRAFLWCKNLTSIAIPDSVTEIGKYIFEGCENLREVTMPSRFACSGFERLYGIPENIVTFVDVISYPAEDMENHKPLAPIIDQGSIAGFGSWTLDADGLLIISGKGEMPDWTCDLGVKHATIPSWAKHRKVIKRIWIVMGVTSIGNWAFSCCESLTHIAIPNSVIRIGVSAFWNCTSLTDIAIPDNVTLIGKNAFRNCTSLTDITIPNGVTSIGRHAFWNCTSLTDIMIPDSARSIGRNAFKGCSNLRKVTMPSRFAHSGTERLFGILRGIISFTYVSGYPAMGTDNHEHLVAIIDEGSIAGFGAWTLDENGLLLIRGKGKMPDWAYDLKTERTTMPWAKYRKAIRSIRIASGVTGIGDFAFSKCRSLTKITIPKSVTSIGNYAFCFCENLTSIKIPDSVTNIEYGVFNGCENLKKVTMPSRFDKMSTLFKLFYGISKEIVSFKQ